MPLTVTEILPTKVWADKDIEGTVHVMVQHEGLDAFDFIQIRYRYGYTDNAHQHELTQRLLDMLAPPEATRQARSPDADAARYRWIRHHTRGERGITFTMEMGTMFVLPKIEPVGDIMRGSVAEHLDAAIDAAMKEQANG